MRLYIKKGGDKLILSDIQKKKKYSMKILDDGLVVKLIQLKKTTENCY